MKISEEFKNLITPLTTEEFNQLEKSILKEGCRDALVVCNDTLIDGHNRLTICKKHNIKYKTKEIKLEKDEAKAWIIKNQFARRNLSAYDRSLLALKLEDLYKEEAETRMKGGKKLDPTQKSAEGETRQKLANTAGVSHDTIAKVKVIKEQATKEQEGELRKGESVNKIYQDIRRTEKLKNVEKKVEEFKNKKRDNSSIDIYKTNNKYNIIYADPAWSYFTEGYKNQSLHYNGMTIEDICKLPVERIADDNCILFLWITYPILDRCFEVIKSWGFKYSTCGFVWVKKNKNKDNNFIGLGSWTRSNSELCLIATKGSVERINRSISQIIETPIEEHSKKPDIVRNKITELVGELPRIELFNRQKIKGWDSWGNEI